MSEDNVLKRQVADWQTEIARLQDLIAVATGKGMDTASEFAEGVIYTCARLIEVYDLPTVAKNILAGADVDMSMGNEYDLAFIRRIPEFANLPTGKE